MTNLELALADLPFWPSDAVARLASSWITTAEQLVATAAVDTGLDMLAAQSGLDRQRLISLVAQTKHSLTPATVARLSQVEDTSSRGLGALIPKKDGFPD